LEYNKRKNIKSVLKIIGIILLLTLLIIYWLCLPSKLFNNPTSTVIEDRTGLLLGAKIANDGQWRFPYNTNVPEKFKIAILEFEDRHFYKHPGINPISLIRATFQNIKSWRIISGGSTLTMQVIRLSSRGKPRTIFEKVREIILATRLELTYSKNKILSLYASNAPFGGNVVGLDAASWRYYGRSPEDLSWSEVATLAVLPNAPSLIYPGRNRKDLLIKRNNLLDRLLTGGYLDTVSCELAKAEPLPGKPLPLDQSAPHLLTKLYLTNKGERIRTTLNYELQNSVNEIVQYHNKMLKHSEIHNAAAIVVEVETGNVLAYMGNTRNPHQPEHGGDVDIITAPRSSGSILKPVLYAAMLDAGEILPNTLIPDIPTQISGYIPKNFSLGFDGAVPASKALSRSLNVPAVKMLQQYGVFRFYDLLKKLDMQTLSFSADHYGLSLILGGAETTLWDLAGIYSSFSRVINHFYEYNGRYADADWHKPVYILDSKGEPENDPVQFNDKGILNASSVWLTYQALLEVNRPDELAGWRSFTSTRKIAWKTGTSFGFRDAWAVGTTSKYVVAVWAGNADGEGRSGLTGVSVAAPVMFDIFNVLPSSGWFDPPYDEMVKMPVCRMSGYRASSICEPIDSIWIQRQGLKTPPCPYHKLVHLDKTGKCRVNSNCYDPLEMAHKSWFILPPVMEWYYKSKNPLYKPLPPFREDCLQNVYREPMEFIYPASNTRLYLPLELDGTLGSIVLEVAHHDPDAIIYWHLNNEYIGLTKHLHQLAIQPEAGTHLITIVDNKGNTISKRIEIFHN